MSILHIGAIFTLFFLSYSITNALPVWGVVPFIFDIAILLYIGISVGITGFVFYISKYKKKISYFFLALSLLSSGVIFIWFGYIQWSFINLSTSLGILDYRIFIMVIFLSMIISIISAYKYKKVSLLFLTSLVLLSVNTPLLYSAYELNTKFSALIELFYIETDKTLYNITPKILNNIVVSQDFKYKQDDKYYTCRVTLSYYKNKFSPGYSLEALKEKNISLYTGVDYLRCKKLIKPLYIEHILYK